MRYSKAGVVTIGVLGFLLATNPLVAHGASLITGKDIADGTITGRDVKNSSLTTKDVRNHSLRRKDFKSGSLPRGAAGPAGAQGPQGVVAVGTWAGATSAIPAVQTSFAFLGPTTTVTVAAGQTIVADSTSVLATGGGSSLATGNYYLCYQAPGGPLTLFGGSSSTYLTVQVDSAKRPYAVSAAATPPAAGSYTVGGCFKNSGTVAISNPDWTTGWAQVLDATPSQTSRVTSSTR